jgi:hypothetical protein
MKKMFIVMFAFLLAFGISAKADAISLQALFDGGEIIVDDKRFFDWTLIDP